MPTIVSSLSVRVSHEHAKGAGSGRAGDTGAEKNPGMGCPFTAAVARDAYLLPLYAQVCRWLPAPVSLLSNGVGERDHLHPGEPDGGHGAATASRFRAVKGAIRPAGGAGSAAHFDVRVIVRILSAAIATAEFISIRHTRGSLFRGQTRHP